MRILAIIIAIIAYFLTVVEVAAGQTANLVRPELLADTTAVQADKPFTVGLRLHIADGWHVYWINPGDAGAPTTLKLTVPPGFTVGPVQYPVPEKITLPGGLVIYAYEKELLLTASISPPSDLRGMTNIPISAAAGWCVCDPEKCVLKKARLQLTLPVGAGEPSNAGLFAAWNSRMPVSSGQVFSQPIHQVVGIVDQQPMGSRFIGGTVTVTWRHVPKASRFDWLPLPSDYLEFHVNDVGTGGNVTTVDWRGIPPASANPGEDRTNAIEGVLAYYEDGQPPRGVLISFISTTLAPIGSTSPMPAQAVR
jgi:hypothetical protein